MNTLPHLQERKNYVRDCDNPFEKIAESLTNLFQTQCPCPHYLKQTAKRRMKGKKERAGDRKTERKRNKQTNKPTKYSPASTREEKYSSSHDVYISLFLI